MADLTALQAALGHTFADSALLQAALTHPSAQKSRGVSAYERLEFLGDRVLGLALANWLFELHPAEAEGALARRHAALAKRETLAAIASDLDLLDYLQLASGERENPRGHLTILGDALEALLGAIARDAGYLAAEACVRRLFAAAMAESDGRSDTKTALQEYAQGRGWPLPAYRLVAQSGPSHAPTFTVEVSLPNQAPVTAEATSKQLAEKAAAAALLAQLEKQS